jgi:hypothetical protein
MENMESGELVIKSIQGCSFENNKIELFVTTDKGEGCLDFTPENFKKLFPLVVYTNNQYILTTKDKTMGIPFDPKNKEFLKLIDMHETCFESFLSYSENDKYNQLVKEAGYENEYCLIFGGKVFFHSPHQEEMEEYNKSHHLDFKIYYPPKK